MLIPAADYKDPVFELDTSGIEDCMIVTTMDALLRGAKAFFEQPGAEEHFQEWKRRKAEAAKK